MLDYHERTKHHTFRYAAGPGFLDWASQPNPFRRFASSPLIELPLPPVGNPLLYRDLYTPGAIPQAPLDPASISRFLRYSLSLTAWKEFESTRWALRANPSSGNLHPTEGYLILPPLAVGNARPAVYHYAPREHGLELRAELDDDVFRALMASLPDGAFLAGLSSVHWREAWKYGERAYRYCQHDVGHALAALRIAAAALGWRLHLLDAASDQAVASLLGIDRDVDYVDAEREHPDLMAVVTTAQDCTPGTLPIFAEQAVLAVRAAAWNGRANALSERHNADWPIIATVAEAARHGGGRADADVANNVSLPPPARRNRGDGVAPARTAEQVILGRRSAVAMDGATPIRSATLYAMLARLMPGASNAAMPWDAIPWRPHIHLALFVHRVTGLAPGIYALARDPEKVERLRAAMSTEFAWERPPSCPPGLPLFHLRTKDVRALAADVSCGQDIAGDGAFSLGMLAELRDGISRFGASFYRRLFWEAGLVGQVLYLEAEEAGVRATGIGCYFDDHMHDVLGITGRELQSLYHFTVGAAVEDRRLSTLPAYTRGATGG